MHRRIALFAALALGIALQPAAVLAQPGDGLDLAIRDTRLAEDGTTEVIVNVTGPAKPDVLGAGAFTVREQGEAVSGLDVEPLLASAGAGVALSLAVDVSGSMEGQPMAVTIDVASDFASQLTDQGVAVQVISFASTVEVLTDFSTDTDEVVDAIQGLEAAGATLLYDAIIEASAQLAAQPRQPNLVVFSDGGDNGSEGTLAQAIAAAQEIDTPIVTVAFETEDLDPDALQAMAEETSGRVLAGALDELEDLFAETARDIASQYVLRYTSTRLEPPTLDLEVVVAAGGTQASASFAVPNPREEVREAVPPQTVGPASALLTSRITLIVGVAAAFVALALLLGFLITSARTRGDRMLGQQLERYIEHGDTRAGRHSSVAAHFRDRAAELFEATPRPRGLDAKLTRRLEQAAWPLKNSEFIALVVLAGVGVAVLVGVVFNWLGGLLVGVIAASIPFLILARRRSRRRAAFLRVLPDTLQLMAGSLRAGYGVMQAIDTVAKQSDPPTSLEFGRAVTETRLGSPVEDALHGIAERVDSDDFRWVVLAINIQREVGGNLAELLDTVAEVLREREMLRRQIRVLSAEGRLSAVILIGLPILLAIYMILVRPEYIATLVTSGPIGWILVIMSALLMVVGTFWIRKLIQIEV